MMNNVLFSSIFIYDIILFKLVTTICCCNTIFMTTILIYYNVIIPLNYNKFNQSSIEMQLKNECTTIM